MKRVVIPLLALLLAACVLCAGASAGDITIGSSSNSGSTVISIPEISDGEEVSLEAFITSGKINGAVTLSVLTGVNFTMKDVTATYPEVVSSLKIGKLGVEIENATTYAGPFTAPLDLNAAISSIPESSETAIAEITGKYFNETGSFAAQDISVTVTIGSRVYIADDIKGHVNISVADSVVSTVNFIVNEDEPEPTTVPPTATPTSSGGGGSGPSQTVKPTASPTPVKLQPTAKIVEETVTIPDDGKVTLGETEVVKEITVPTEIVKENPGAQVEVTEGNAEVIDLPVGVTADEVAIVVEVSVVDKDGKKIDVESEGSFVLTLNVPSGKIPVVGHYNSAGVWENCAVKDLGNGQYEVTYSSLSPFAVLFIETGAANPLLSQPTATPTAVITAEPTTVVPTTAVATTAAPSATATKSPVPFFGLIAGLAAAGLVLSRK